MADMPARNISVGQWLPGPVAAKVVGHELGHAIDDLAGTIPTVGLNTELRSVYNDLNNPDLALARKRNPNIDPNATGSPPKLRNHGPEMLGYRGDAVQRELVAEALRAYMGDPNYLKTVAPKTAVTVRAAINSNPRLARTIQFNAGPAGPLGVGLFDDDTSDR